MLDSSYKIGAKKTFFLYPSKGIEDNLIRNLVRQEYEAFPVKDAQKIVPVLKNYSNSIVLINLDSGPRNFNWEKYISDISDKCTDLKIGAFYYDNSLLHLSERFSNTSFGKTVFEVEQGFEALLPQLVLYLEKQNARGERRYIRAKCDDAYSASFSIKFKSEIYSGKLQDISSYGMACSFSSDPDLLPKTYLDDIQLRLNGAVSDISGLVYGIRELKNEKLYVIVFDYKNKPATRNRIHDFIFNKMHREIRKRFL